MNKAKFIQTEIGLIPDDWEVNRIGNVSEIFGRIGFRGYTVEDLVDEGFGAITLSPSNIQNGRMDFSNCSYISWKKYDESPEIKIANGDILLVKTGSTYGKSAIVKNLTKKATINPQVVVIKKTKCNNELLGYLIQTPTVQEQIEASIVGGAIPTLSQKQIASFKIPLSKSLAEQQRIAKALSDVDTLISTTEKLIQKKKNIKQGAMQNLLTGKKRLPGFGPQTKSPTYKQTELGPIPEDWEVKKLSEFGTFSKGSGISREESNTGEYPAVRYGELYTTHNDYIKSFYSHISYEVASKSKKINKGDLLFTCSGETKEDIGKCVAFIGNEKAYAGGDLLILSPTINIDSLFYGFLLNTTVAVKQKSSMAQGDAVVHISAESIGKIRVPFPSKEEQTAIANVLSSMDKEIETLNTKLEKYRNLKTAMMQQLLTGKIRLDKKKENKQ